MANTTMSDMSDELSGFNISWEEAGALLASYGLILVIVLQLGYRLYIYKSFLIAVVAAWGLWFGTAIVFTGSISVDSMIERLSAVQQASHGLLLACQVFVLAWFEVLMPFWSDVSVAMVHLWGTLDTTTKVTIVCTGFFCWALAKAFLKARQHADQLKAVAFQASFLVVGPALWYMSTLVFSRTPAWCLPVAVRAMVSFLPLVQSIRVFESLQKSATKKANDASNLWLSYWAAWPTVNFVGGLVLAHAGDVFGMQVILLVLLVWLQLWQGSSHVPDLVMKLFNYLAIPLWSAITPNMPSWVQNPASFVYNNLSSFTAAYNYAKNNKLVSIGVVTLALLIVWKLITTVSGVLTILVWWGASLRTTEVAAMQKRTEYASQLSFWVLALISESLIEVPIIGIFVAMFQPLVLILSMTFGEVMLKFVIKILKIVFKLAGASGDSSKQSKRKISEKIVVEEKPVEESKPAAGSDPEIAFSILKWFQKL